MDDYQKKRSVSGVYSQPKENPRNVTELGTGQTTVTTTPQQISFVARNRSGIKLTNLSNTEVWYGESSSVSPTTGDLLAAGRSQWVSVPGCSILWVVTASGTATIAWAESFSNNQALASVPTAQESGGHLASIDSKLTDDSFGNLKVIESMNSQAIGDGQTNSPFRMNSGTAGQFVGYVAYPVVLNGNSWDRLRTPAIFKQATASASGSTALWTPAAGKHFRLLRFKIQLTADATLAVAARLTIALLDSATDLHLSHLVFVPTTALNTIQDYESGWIDLGNGILSAAVNNVLNINLSVALATGLVNVIACGTEE